MLALCGVVMMKTSPIVNFFFFFHVVYINTCLQFKILYSTHCFHFFFLFNLQMWIQVLEWVQILVYEYTFVNVYSMQYFIICLCFSMVGHIYSYMVQLLESEYLWLCHDMCIYICMAQLGFCYGLYICISRYNMQYLYCILICV